MVGPPDDDIVDQSALMVDLDDVTPHAHLPARLGDAVAHPFPHHPRTEAWVPKRRGQRLNGGRALVIPQGQNGPENRRPQ